MVDNLRATFFRFDLINRHLTLTPLFSKLGFISRIDIQPLRIKVKR